MPKVVGYHRPSSLDEALGLLAQPGTAALAGGTILNADSSGEPVVAVDLQRLGLARIEAVDATHLRIGATVTLQQLADCALVPDTLRDLATRELPSTLRTLATVGGTVAAGGWCSALLGALLAHDAVVSFASPGGPSELELTAALAERGHRQPSGRLVVAVTIATDGISATARTARTPSDEPIVAACARRADDGRVRLALSGVAEVPVVVDDVDALTPPADFRGSTAYRRHVARVLAERVRAAVAA